MVTREIFAVGLKRKVEAEVTDVISTPTKGGGARYQVVGIYEEDGKTHNCQSMIGKDAAMELAEKLGIDLVTSYEVDSSESCTADEGSDSVDTGESSERVANASESFAAEEESVTSVSDAGESSVDTGDASLLVSDPSTSPQGDGRVYGQHTGLNVSGEVGEMSLPAHDYVWAGRAEGETTNDLIHRLREAVEKHEEPAEIQIPLEAGIEEGIDEASELEAEFEDITPSIQNIYDDETFVVETSLKNYLAEEFWEDILQGLFTISATENEDEWVITFPPFDTEEVIEAIATFQSLDLYSRAGYYEEDESVEAFSARNLVDSDDLIEDSDSDVWKAGAVVGTAILALGISYWWANRQK